MRYNPSVVSVGIPTYNRPELVERRLENVLSQTWTDIQVFVADNASPDPRVRDVLERVSRIDRRVSFHVHEQNIGPAANFRFVLGKSVGTFFIWAADDDEWDRHYLNGCREFIGSSQLSFGEASTKYLTTGVSEVVPLPRLSERNSTFENARLFLSNMQPGLIYGLHRREDLLESMFDTDFDFWDLAMVFRAILRKGANFVPGVKYSAGIIGDSYEAKAFGEGGKFSYHPFVKHGLNDIRVSAGLSGLEKVRLARIFLSVTANLVSHLSTTYPAVARKRHHLLASAYNSPAAIKSKAKRAIGH